MLTPCLSAEALPLLKYSRSLVQAFNLWLSWLVAVSSFSFSMAVRERCCQHLSAEQSQIPTAVHFPARESHSRAPRRAPLPYAASTPTVALTQSAAPEGRLYLFFAVHERGLEPQLGLLSTVKVKMAVLVSEQLLVPALRGKCDASEKAFDSESKNKLLMWYMLFISQTMFPCSSCSMQSSCFHRKRGIPNTNILKILMLRCT